MPCGHQRATTPPSASWTSTGKDGSPLPHCMKEHGPAPAMDLWPAAGSWGSACPCSEVGSVATCSSWLAGVVLPCSVGSLSAGLRCLSSTALSSSASTMPTRSCSSFSTWWVSPRCPLQHPAVLVPLAFCPGMWLVLWAWGSGRLLELGTAPEVPLPQERGRFGALRKPRCCLQPAW